MKNTDQYLWNVIFSLFFVGAVVGAAIILRTESRMPLSALTFTDYILITLASWRVTRLFVYDAITKVVREQFYDVVQTDRGPVLQKAASGPRRTLADLFSCPWCFGMWAAAVVTFLYLLSDWMIYPTILLALSAVATFLQLLSNFVGHKAEQLKIQNDG